MRILGIDPGIGLTGWGTIESHAAQCQLQSAGTISTVANTPVHARLAALYDEMKQLMATVRPQEVAIEKLFFSKNVTTAMTVSQARGVILLAASQAKVGIFEYTPMQVKMTITGYGKATKQQINAMLPHHLSGTIPKQDDAADAIAIAVTHLASRGLAGFQKLHAAYQTV